MKIISRSDAKAAGLLLYFTGKPCSRGHVADRTVSHGRCRLCGREYAAKYAASNPAKVRARDLRWREENSERLRASNKANKEKNRERNLEIGRAYNRTNADLRRAYAREYRAERIEEIKKKKRDRYRSDPKKYCAQSRAFRERHPEKVLEYAKSYRAANKSKRAVAQRNREAVKRGRGVHTVSDVHERIKLQRGRCAYCRANLRGKYHVDHIMPLAKGGSNRRANLQILCPPCNMKKYDKDPVVFAQEIGRLL